MTVEEAAKRLGVTPQKVMAMIKEGTIKAEKKGKDWKIVAMKGMERPRQR